MTVSGLIDPAQIVNPISGSEEAQIRVAFDIGSGSRSIHINEQADTLHAHINK